MQNGKCFFSKAEGQSKAHDRYHKVRWVHYLGGAVLVKTNKEFTVQNHFSSLKRAKLCQNAKNSARISGLRKLSKNKQI